MGTEDTLEDGPDEPLPIYTVGTPGAKAIIVLPEVFGWSGRLKGICDTLANEVRPRRPLGATWPCLTTLTLLPPPSPTPLTNLLTPTSLSVNPPTSLDLDVVMWWSERSGGNGGAHDEGEVRVILIWFSTYLPPPS